MPLLKSTSLADVIIYGENGQAVASTFMAQGDEETIFLKTLSMPVATYQAVVASEELVFGENFTIGERSYSLARGKLQVSDDLLGVFAVVLSSDYVVETSAGNRNLYVVDILHCHDCRRLAGGRHRASPDRPTLIAGTNIAGHRWR